MDFISNIEKEKEYPHKPVLCPVSTPKFIEWSKTITLDIEHVKDKINLVENEIKADREKRHDRNAELVTLFDAERLERIELSDQVVRLASMQEELLRVIKGNWETTGVVNQNKKFEERINNLEKLNEKRKDFTSGFLFAVSGLSGIVGAIVSLIGYLFFKK